MKTKKSPHLMTSTLHLIQAFLTWLTELWRAFLRAIMFAHVYYRGVFFALILLFIAYALMTGRFDLLTYALVASFVFFVG